MERDGKEMDFAMNSIVATCIVMGQKSLQQRTD